MATARVERRLAAILAADVVGYSRLMERDEDRTLERLKAHRKELVEPLVAQHHGRIIKLMGDGILCEFGSAVDAVRCAVLVQRGMAEREAGAPEGERILLRIGINLGDVVHEADGDLYGDGVNIAARLEQLCEPGGVLVSGTAYDHLQGKIDLPLDFTGERRVKNIERPVRTYRVRLDGARAASPSLPARRKWALPAAAAVLVALLLAAGAAWWWPWPAEPALTGRPSIAVLPFDNLGGDEATARLVGGITEDIITDLARFREFDVIARNSTAVYAGKPVDVRQVGRDLNVRYVLEGSIQRQGERVRTTAQLIDAGTGAHVWSERWDRPTDDVFAVQTEIAERVASRLGGGGAVAQAERQVAARRARPGNLTAYELYLLGAQASERATREANAEAIRLHSKAVELDPTLARAWVLLSLAHNLSVGYDADPEAARKAALDAAERAVALDPADAEAHAALGEALTSQGEFGRAAAEFETALRLNPGHVEVLTFYSGWASAFGHPERGTEAADRAIRLNPNYAPWAANNFRYAYFMAGRYEDALRVTERQPKENLTRFGLVFRAAIYAALGRAEEARTAAAEALARHPGLTIEGFVNDPGFSDSERQRLIETMRQAGFPPCAKPEELAGPAAPVRLPECAPPAAAR
jgi:TolB-like protein/class 3 adenylate cyclase/Flp pilus assembly protein TadD